MGCFLVVLVVVALKTRARRLMIRRFFAVTFLTGASIFIVTLGAALGFLESTGVPLEGGNGDHLWLPSSLAQVAHDYRGKFGVGTLDLSAVRFPSSGFRITVSIAAGALRIAVPANAVVDLTTNVGVGTVTRTAMVILGVTTAPLLFTATGHESRRVAPRTPCRHRRTRWGRDNRSDASPIIRRPAHLGFPYAIFRSRFAPRNTLAISAPFGMEGRPAPMYLTSLATSDVSSTAPHGISSVRNSMRSLGW